MSKDAKISEKGWLYWWAVAVILLSSIPYLMGWYLTPPGFSYLGFTHNIDDAAVYMSWMRQAADGHFFITNLFTGGIYGGRAFNALFLVMGGFAGVTHIPLVIVYHLFRAVLTVVLLWSIWRFSFLFLRGELTRKLLIPLVGLSSGVGWLFMGSGMRPLPVDMWQPEAITFLSIYLNPLFLAGLILMVWAFYFLEQSRRSGSYLQAVYAGVVLLFLGNIHTYDVLTVGCVWLAYLIALAIMTRRFPSNEVLCGIIAASLAVPSLAYQFYIYALDPLYKARVNTPALSPPFYCYLLGYGVVLVGAIIGAGIAAKAENKARIETGASGPPNNLLLIVWSVIGFVVPYIPVSQQRKLVMGLHIPLCILCAYALSVWATRSGKRTTKAAIACVMAVMAISNLIFVFNDSILLLQGKTVTHYAAYMPEDDLKAICWLGENTRIEHTILASPTAALFIPGMIGRRVYYGHWSETPHHDGKLREWVQAVTGESGSDKVVTLLRDSGVSFYMTSDMENDNIPQVAASWLQPEFESGNAAVYRVMKQ